MGTNFYWVDESSEYGEGEHIGKRSAAGLYCWDCRVTLCNAGERGVHDSRSGFHDRCPKCNAPRISEDLASSPAGVELGFAQPRVDKPEGVRGCSSFSWASEPEAVRQRCEANLDAEDVVDEYGRRITCGEFLRMLKANCPIEFRDHIGREFS